MFAEKIIIKALLVYIISYQMFGICFADPALSCEFSHVTTVLANMHTKQDEGNHYDLALRPQWLKRVGIFLN